MMGTVAHLDNVKTQDGETLKVELLHNKRLRISVWKDKKWKACPGDIAASEFIAAMQDTQDPTIVLSGQRVDKRAFDYFIKLVTMYTYS